MALDLARITKVLSPKQIRSIVEASTTPQIALWHGAVRSGKTVASLLAFLIALTVAPDGLVLIIGKTLDSIERNLIGELQKPSLFGPIARHVHHTRGATTAVILGRVVHLIGAPDVKAEDRIRGATVALAYVDEATIIPKGFWMMLVSRLSVIGARLLATTNPDGPAHWLRQEFLLRPADVGLRAWQFTLADNPSLSTEFVERLKRQYTGLWHRRFILSEWCLAEGAVYDMWDPDKHIVEIPDVPPIQRWIGLGVDYGTTNPFAALLLGIGRDPLDDVNRLYFVDEWRYDSKIARRSLTDAEYSERLRGWLAGVEWPGAPGLRGVRPEWTVVDPSAASFVQQLYHDGLTPTQADNSVVDGIRLVASLLARDLLRVSRRCTGWIEETPGYSWDPKAAARGEDKPIKAADHSLDAGRYDIKTTEAIWRPHLELLEAA